MILQEEEIYKNPQSKNILNQTSIDLLEVLREGVKPALGCTEPVALGLAVAEAYKNVKGELLSMNIQLSPNIYKNGMGVGIPGTRKKGLVFAAALAVVCGDSSLGLEVFKNVNDKYVIKAEEIVNQKNIQIGIESNKGNFYIRAKVLTDKGEGVCVIENKHTNIVFVQANDRIVFKDEKSKLKANKEQVNSLTKLTMKDIIKFVEKVPFNDIEFLLEGVKINMAIAQKGLDEKPGPGLGAAMKLLMSEGEMQKDVINKARILTSAACDARMAGVNMPVMSSAGSGNHGITAIIPPAVVCKHMGCDDEKLARTLAFSHLTTAYIKAFTGVLSPVCGCGIAAGIGASAAITWLMGGSEGQIEGAIKNMVGSICGMVCDGAKGGCSFKLATAASEAIIQAKLAIANIFISDFDGIVGHTADSTIRNLGKFCTKGMKDTDKEIIEIMTGQ